MPRKRLFPPRKTPTGRRLRHKGRQKVGRDTVNGSIAIERTYWRSQGHGRDETIDQVLGIVAERVSVGVRQMCARVAIAQQGFRKAAEHLHHLAQIRISPERLRGMAQHEGRKVSEAQSQGVIEPSVTPQNCRIAAEGPSRIYLGVDGVKVPMVTAEEKAKRRKKRAPKRPGTPPRRMHRGADNAYKEFKIATFYDASNTHRQVLVTAGDHQVLGRDVRRQAGHLGLNRFDQKIAVADGADWIHRQLTDKIPTLDAFILDYFHLSEHICEAANTCFGINTPQAKSVGSQWRHLAKDQGGTELLLRVAAERKMLRSPRKRRALTELIGYLSKRISQCDYPRYVREGWQIGSGPTEAMCKVLTCRLKGSGMRWDRQGAEPMMALIALEQSNAWKTYWNAQKQAA